MKKIDAEQIHKILSSNEVIGKIIRDVAGLEWELELVLTRYFATQERFFEFWQLLMDRFTFAEKIDILRKMKLPTKMKSQANAAKSLDKFRKVRNILAHHGNLSEKEIAMVESDNELRKLFQDFPKSFDDEARNTSNRLNRLLYSHLVRTRKALNKKIQPTADSSG